MKCDIFVFSVLRTCSEMSIVICWCLKFGVEPLALTCLRIIRGGFRTAAYLHPITSSDSVPLPTSSNKNLHTLISFPFRLSWHNAGCFQSISLQKAPLPAPERTSLRLDLIHRTSVASRAPQTDPLSISACHPRYHAPP